MTHRIAIVAHHALGGSGVMAVEWAYLLASRGHEVHLVRCGRSARDGMPRGVGANGPVLHELSAPSHPVLDGPSAVAAVTSRLVQLHEQAPLDVVHIHYALPFALAVPALRTLPSPPRCVVSLHGSDVTGVGGDPAYAPAMGLALRSAHAVTVPSRWLAQEAEARAIAPVSAIDVLPNFVDLEHFTPAPPLSPRPTVVQAFGDDDGTPVVLHMSNLRAVKRAEDTVEILAALRRVTPARLLLVGDGPGREALRERARRELGASVGWVGAVQDPAPYFRDADCLLLPSETESFGLVALEALACGTPVVASRAGGLPGWLTDVPAAALCPVGDHEAFATALATFLARGRGALSASARESAESIGAASVAASVAESLYARPASPPTAPGETPCWPSPS